MIRLNSYIRFAFNAALSKLYIFDYMSVIYLILPKKSPLKQVYNIYLLIE